MEGSRGQLTGRSGAQEGEDKPSEGFFGVTRADVSSGARPGGKCAKTVLVHRLAHLPVRRGFFCGPFKNSHRFHFERYVQKRLCF